MLRFVREYSAGGIVVRRHRGWQVLMIKDYRGRWTIPKGHVEEGEALEQTAIREIGEETGLTKLNILDRLDKVHFFYRREGKLIFMTVYVFLVEATGDEPLVMEVNEGITGVRWFPVAQALKQAAYENQVDLLKKGLKKLGQRDLNKWNS